MKKQSDLETPEDPVKNHLRKIPQVVYGPPGWFGKPDDKADDAMSEKTEKTSDPG